MREQIVARKPIDDPKQHVWRQLERCQCETDANNFRLSELHQTNTDFGSNSSERFGACLFAFQSLRRKREFGATTKRNLQFSLNAPTEVAGSLRRAFAKHSSHDCLSSKYRHSTRETNERYRGSAEQPASTGCRHQCQSHRCRSHKQPKFRKPQLRLRAAQHGAKLYHCER